MDKKATIHDIARELNITAATVSRALNNKPRVSKTTRDAVLEAARRLNYKPNSMAAGLRLGKSNVIGIIVPTANRMFFSSVVRGVEEIANSHGYNVMISQTYDSYERERFAVEALANARVECIISSVAKSTEDFRHYQKLREDGIPLILFDRLAAELDTDHVIVNDYEGAYEAVAHLISQGFRRIAHFAGKSSVSIYRERERGYREALADHGLRFDEKLLRPSNLQLEDGRRELQELLKLPEPPDAVFSASDYAAVGAFQMAKEQGLKIPVDIGIVGFSNEPFTDFTEPGITSVDQRSVEMGHAAAEIFFNKNKGSAEEPQHIMLPAKLVVRGSSLRRS